MFDLMRTFWEQNSSSIIVSAGVGFLFFVLGPLGLWFSGRKIKKERIRKAKEVLIDLLEGMIVNQGFVDAEKLRLLFLAVERDVDIDLSGEYRIVDWLNDVVLRVERSRHLGSDQKKQYYDYVKMLSDDLLKSRVEQKSALYLNKYEHVVDELKVSLDGGDVEKAKKLVL